MMKCPYCDNGTTYVPLDWERGLFDEDTCKYCNGTGEILTIKEQNAKELKTAWKRFLRTQNEKEKAKKENQKAEEKS